MYPVNADKEKIIQIVNQWILRSGLGIEQVLARMQTAGYDIARSTFENRFTTRVQQKPNIPPDCFQALIVAFTDRLTDQERCTAGEAIEMANLARLPIDQFKDIQKHFPQQEFVSAFEQYISPLFGQTHLIQPVDTSAQPASLNNKSSSRTSANNGPPLSNESEINSSASLYEDWGDAPDVTTFIGRSEELATLSNHILNDRGRLIAILGIGGMGKTTLAKMLAERVKDDFDYLFWVSLRDGPSMFEVVDECIRFLSSGDDSILSTLPERRISALLKLLKNKRSLLIFDGAEAVLEEGIQTGGYVDKYDDYAELFQKIGQSSHNSCLLLTSREKPEEFVLMEAESSPIHSLSLHGLSVNNAREVLNNRGLYGDDESWQKLVSGYSGNPLALKLASEPISEVYGGDIEAFLKGSVSIVTGVRDLLDTHFSRLTLLERSVLYWLAIEREALPPDALLKNFVENISETELLEALRWLRRRSLIEQNASGLTLQNMVMEYMTGRFVGLMVDEIEAEFPMLLSNFTLMKGDAKEYVRKSQYALFVAPIADALIRRIGKVEASRILSAMLLSLKAEDSKDDAQMDDEIDINNASNEIYQAGNILNLLICLGVSLEGSDLAYLQIRNADLRGIMLRDADLSYSDCSGSIFTDTFGSITSAAFSPLQNTNGSDDNALLVVGDAGGDVRLWDMANHRQLNAFSGHTDLIWSVAFSPNRRTIASCGEDQTIRLWDVPTGECIALLVGHTGWVKDVAFNHDGSVLASCSNDGTVRLWNVEAQTCLATIDAHDGWIWSVVFSPDGSLFATAGQDGLVKLWCTETQKTNITNEDSPKSPSEIRTYAGHTGAVHSVRFSPDGRWVASGSVDHLVRLWDIETDKVYELKGHENQIWTVAFSPDSRLLASGGDDQTLRLWQVDTQKQLRVLRGNPSRIWTTAFSPDGRTLVSGSDDQTLRFWDVSTGNEAHILEGYSNQIWTVDFSPVNNLIANAGDDKKIYLWQLDTLIKSNASALQDAPLPKTRLSQNGSTASDASIGAIGTVQPIQLAGHIDRVRSLAFSRDGQMLVSGGDDHLVRLWESHSTKEIHQLSGHTNRVWSVAISPDQRMLASSSEDQTIRLWRLPSGRCFRIIPVNHRIWSVTFSPDSNLLASASDDSLIHLWDVKKGHNVLTLSGHTGRVWSLAFGYDSPSSNDKEQESEQTKSVRLISGGDDGCVRLWDVATGDLVLTLEGHSALVCSVAYSPNGWIASGSDDQTIRIWDAATGELLRLIHAHEGSVRSIVFGPDNMIISGGSDEHLRCWDIKNGQLLLDLRTDRPYERMNIAGLSGLSPAQIDTLQLLGAINESNSQ